MSRRRSTRAAIGVTVTVTVFGEGVVLTLLLLLMALLLLLIVATGLRCCCSIPAKAKVGESGTAGGRPARAVSVFGATAFFSLTPSIGLLAAKEIIHEQ